MKAGGTDSTSVRSTDPTARRQPPRKLVGRSDPVRDNRFMDAAVGLPSIAVLGGGVAGVMSAIHLARSGKWNVDLFEASDALGGLHQSPMVDGVPFDIGAFVFDSSHGYFSTFPSLRQAFVPIEYGGGHCGPAVRSTCIHSR